MWGGRFRGVLDPRIDALNRSFGFDRRLFEEEIDGSVAWARALRRAGVYDARELETVVAGLERVRGEFRQGRFREQPTDEDVHTAVERRLVELAGPAGEKIHAGRSRNDQVATDLHLWLKKACDAAVAAVRDLQRGLVALAEQSIDVVMPAYTHQQRAQPVLAAHHLLAYAEMLDRDAARLGEAKKRADSMPLGSGACVGTGFPIDRKSLAKELGFARVSGNSLDAVGSRDAALEYLAAVAILGVHLSRLGGEIVAWSSSEFGFVKLSDRVSTGSSILPQKRNPDGAELARGRAGKLLGRFVALATTLKGLPLAYNKDLQEDKEACFEASDGLLQACAGLAATVDGIAFDRERCAAALAGGHMLAIEIADHLARKGVPFRRAHAIAGGLVREAESRGVEVQELPLETMRAAAPEIGPDLKKRLTVAAALASRSAEGGTASSRVRRALRAMKKRLGP
jgi:argininosuccinate lyase